MKSGKKYVVIISIIILILILFFILTVIAMLNNESSEDIISSTNQNDYTFSEVTDATSFYIVEQCILDNMKNGEFLVITDMIEQCIVENRITGYVAKVAYLSDDDSIEYSNYIVYLDFENSTYKIEQINNSNTDLQEVNLQTNISEINEEDGNVFEYNELTTKQKLQNYLDTICLLSLNAPELAYSYLHEGYANYGIENLEDFEEFITDNQDLFENVVIDTYTEQKNYKNEEKDRYVIVTTEGNSFVLFETAIMKIIFMAGRGV